jgi:tRNA nucleotidyltransferase (CCA-adding enzyme)
VMVMMDGVPVEVSTFKGIIEGQPDLYEDLRRRDFTINAIAMDENGVIHDPFGGRKDLKEQIVRSPLNQSMERFQEDPLRMLRAIRFAVGLDFFFAPYCDRGYS